MSDRRIIIDAPVTVAPKAVDEVTAYEEFSKKEELTLTTLNQEISATVEGLEVELILPSVKISQLAEAKELIAKFKTIVQEADEASDAETCAQYEAGAKVLKRISKYVDDQRKDINRKTKAAMDNTISELKAITAECDSIRDEALSKVEKFKDAEVGRRLGLIEAEFDKALEANVDLKAIATMNFEHYKPLFGWEKPAAITKTGKLAKKTKDSIANIFSKIRNDIQIMASLPGYESIWAIYITHGDMNQALNTHNINVARTQQELAEKAVVNPMPNDVHEVAPAMIEPEGNWERPDINEFVPNPSLEAMSPMDDFGLKFRLLQVADTSAIVKFTEDMTASAQKLGLNLVFDGIEKC